MILRSDTRTRAGREYCHSDVLCQPRCFSRSGLK